MDNVCGICVCCECPYDCKEKEGGFTRQNEFVWLANKNVKKGGKYD